METNNRPMVKVVEYEFENISEFRAIKFMWTENKEILNSPKYYKETGNTRIIERPMNDTEYIEHLENKIESNGLSAAKTAMAQCDRIDELWYENQELKEHNINQRKAFAILLNEEEDKYKKEFRELNDKLLKVVESVIQNQIEQAQNPTMMVMLNWMKEHLLQEIKSAIEKGKE